MYMAIRSDGKTSIFDDDYQVTDWFDNLWYCLAPSRNGGPYVKYYIAKKDGKYAYLDNGGKRISDWFDGIYGDDFEKGKSDYYIAEKDGKKAVFHKSGKQVTDWLDTEILKDSPLIKGDGTVIRNGEWQEIDLSDRLKELGLLKEDKTEIKYEIRENEEDKKAVFDKDGNRISDWFDWILDRGLVEGESDYYIAGKDGKCAIFDKDGNQISDWVNEIWTYGLVDGKSEYFIVAKDKKKAIFHKDGTQISDWFDWIRFNGLVSGESDYYIAEKDGKQAIFDKDGNRVTEWFDYISMDGLVVGESDYYLAEKGGKKAIFHKSGVNVIDWMDIGMSVELALIKGVTVTSKEKEIANINNYANNRDRDVYTLFQIFRKDIEKEIGKELTDEEWDRIKGKNGCIFNIRSRVFGYRREII